MEALRNRDRNQMAVIVSKAADRGPGLKKLRDLCRLGLCPLVIARELSK